MGSLKSLAKDTAIYGLSSIIGRFLNWLLVPLYTYLFAKEEYGVVSYIYSFVALALVILTYGMETGFFRFANRSRSDNPVEVYTTSLSSLAITSALFIGLIALFLPEVSDAIGSRSYSPYVMLMAATVGIDAFSSIPFAWLRFERRPMRFALLRLIGIGVNIGLNIFFLLLCPRINEIAPGAISWFYNPDFGIGYIFLANFLGSVVTLLFLTPELTRCGRWRFNIPMLREMLRYSWPLLIFGVAGIMNQTIGTIIFPRLLPPEADPMGQLGIYSANYKIAIVMIMFIQAFRFAYEPFIFAKAKEDTGNADTSARRSSQLFADTMTYFVIFSMFIFLGVMAYLDVLRHFISSAYFSGLKVVPILMIAEFFFGVFFNLSLWYKLTDQTIWGTWFSLLGLAVTVGLLLWLVPLYGYMGCAWAAFGCYAVMMTASYLVGRKKHPIPYRLGSIALYFFGALAAYALMCALTTGHQLADMGIRTIILLIYIVLALRNEHLTLRSLLPRTLARHISDQSISTDGNK